MAWTHRVRLHAITRHENAVLFDHDVSRVPREVLSMGVGTIFRARNRRRGDRRAESRVRGAGSQRPDYDAPAGVAAAAARPGRAVP